MNIELRTEAVEYGVQVRRALEAAGGDKLARLAEREPERRAGLVAPVLADLGAWELEPRRDAVELEAAAALCHSAGYWAAPYPVAERLSRPADLDVDGLIVVSDFRPEGAVAGLDLRWAAVTLDGHRGGVESAAPPRSPRTSAFVTELQVRPLDDNGAADVALGLVLPCWTLLGMLDRVLELARAHVLMRKQFGKPLAEFQGVQFQLTDAEVERGGVEMLARFALWSIQTGRADVVADALALRLAAVEAADIVFRVAHQLHGAIGFCDETTLSWLSRYSLPLRRLPFGLSGTVDQLTRRMGRSGLAGLFSDPMGV
ncbi:acyl-CoA dehydrogenase family protein [Nocardia sp. NBC_00565]|uniref:acyl-CoA dehydrogenase family protein n=1 Tax=Nocardia sp. NBC_00565 TaxID=2975993 RepID=UPI002E81DF1B|nr:acyl-CoA dehydrogenase family protein [Nocardia sp. NBC_00565]WUC05531.1 acyl-CoA dehydrogenase family protein [Nocardia sp. NBC_00565]